VVLVDTVAGVVVMWARCQGLPDKDPVVVVAAAECVQVVRNLIQLAAVAAGLRAQECTHGV
jgi:hypothetical protein